MRGITCAVTTFIAIGLVGCGDDGPTKAAFIAQADRICQAGNDRLATAATALGTAPSAARVRRFATATAAPTLRRELRELRALSPPSGDEREIEALLDELDAAIRRLTTDPAALSGRVDPFTAANAKARAYGLRVCGAG